MRKENKSSNIMVITFVIALAVLGCIYSCRNQTQQNDQTAGSTAVVDKDEKPMARIDITTRPVETQPQFEVYLNGAEKPLREAASMPKNHNMQGVVIQRNEGVADIVIKPIKDAKIMITLRGEWSKNENGEWIEKWVKFKGFTINGEDVIPESVSVWYGRPFVYVLEADAGTEYKLHLEWLQDEE